MVSKISGLNISDIRKAYTILAKTRCSAEVLRGAKAMRDICIAGLRIRRKYAR